MQLFIKKTYTVFVNRKKVLNSEHHKIKGRLKLMSVHSIFWIYFNCGH